MDDVGVHCWGDDFIGQTNVPALHHPTKIAAGGLHACAMNDDGVNCWGWNDYGQAPESIAIHPVDVAANDLATYVVNENGDIVTFGFGANDVPIWRE
ncbi:hypothetical protein E3A20_12270 [Planctomyces bekefii]|uniref:Uncharacterized protein n=1 Tax=Planctomyces bekefii TaxID=1653850 RepID=A0A5C6M4J6_9PLAN|nr:hypothetical protein E3A20_12270 [Planctomyces bekefii]